MKSIPRIRRELIARFERLVHARAKALGIGTERFRDWVDGSVGEAIALAIVQQDKWDPNKGDFLFWCFLKARALIRAELEGESRYQRAIRRLRVLAPTGYKPAYPDTRAMREEVVELLEQLTETQQKALVLYYVNGMSARALGDVLGKKPKAVHELLRRARLKALKVAGCPSEPGPIKHQPLTPEERERKRVEREKVLERLFGL